MSTTDTPSLVEKKAPTERQLSIRNYNKQSRRIRLRFLRFLVVFLLAWFLSVLGLGVVLGALLTLVMFFSSFLTLGFFLKFMWFRLRVAYLRTQADPPAPSRESVESSESAESTTEPESESEPEPDAVAA